MRKELRFWPAILKLAFWLSLRFTFLWGKRYNYSWCCFLRFRTLAIKRPNQWFFWCVRSWLKFSNLLPFDYHLSKIFYIGSFCKLDNTDTNPACSYFNIMLITFGEILWLFLWGSFFFYLALYLYNLFS